MELGNAMFWLFLAATTIASLTFIAVLVWTESRLKERQEFYRFEFRKRMIEAGKMDAASFAGLMQYEHELRLQQARQKLLTAGFVILGTGVGTCFGLRFIDGPIWMLGLIPACIGLFMLAFGFLFAAKGQPGPPPFDASPEVGERN